MSDNLERQIKVGVDATGAEVGAVRVTKSLDSIGATAARVGKEGAESLGQMDQATRRFANQFEREIAKAKTAGEGLARQLEELANIRGADIGKLRPRIDELEMLQQAAAAAATAQQRLADDQAFARKLDDAAKLAKASDYVRFWEDSLKQAEETEKRLAAQSSFVTALEKQVDALGKSRSELLAMQAAELGVSEKAAPLIAKMREQEQALGKAANGAGQLTFALRQLPAQLTDIVVGLQSGQAPMTVLLQQGGQLKDVFGGVGPAAKALGGYIAGLVTPMTLAAAAAALVVYGLYKVADQAQQVQRTLILSGNAVGATRDELLGMADAAAHLAGGSMSGAVDVISQMAAGGKVGADNLKAFAAAAIGLERAGGPAIKETVDAFNELAKSPLEASKKLNEGMHYLTASTYEHIKSLVEQGRVTDAAKAAQLAYFDAISQRIPDLQRNLGFIERLWQGVKDATAAAANAALNVGRPKSLQDLEAELRNAQIRQKELGNGGLLAVHQASVVEDLQKEVALRREAEARTKSQAVAAAERAKHDEAATKWLDEGNKFLTRQEQMSRAVAEIEGQRDTALKGVAAGTEERVRIETEAQKRIAQVRQQFDTGVNLQEIQNAEGLRLEAVRTAEAKIQALRATGAMTERGELVANADLALKSIDIRRAALVQELALAKRRSDSERDVAALTGQIASSDAARKTAEAQKDASLAAYDHALSVRTLTAAYDDYLARQKEVRDEQARASKAREALELQNFEEERTLRASLESAEAGVRMLGLTSTARAAEIEKLRIELDLKRKLYDVDHDVTNYTDDKQRNLARSQFRDNAQLAKDAADLAGALNIGDSLAEGFDRASKAMAGFVNGFTDLIDKQEAFNRAREVLKRRGDDKGIVALDEAQFRSQISMFGNLTGAAKGFFSEGSRGYKALETAEKGFRAVELALAIKNAAEKIGLIGAVTSAKVAGDQTQTSSAVTGAASEIAAQQAVGQATAVTGIANQSGGDPYSAFPRMAAMAAIMAALGFVVSGAGGSSAAPPPSNTGTGTVFGDASAKSESLSKSIDRLADVDTLTMHYSAQMLASLRNIEASLAGVTNLVLRNGDVNTGNSFGIFQGVVSTNDRDPLLSALGLGGLANSIHVVLKNIPVIGSLVKGFESLWGKTTQEISGAGLYISSSLRQLEQAQGLQQYADVKTTKSSWFGLKKSTSYSTVTQALDPELAKQFGMVFDSFDQAIQAAAGPLGVSLDEIAKRLDTFVVDIGRVDLKGLSGKDLQDKLSAVFGAAGDRIAQAALSGFDDFQKVGEGYLETVIRVASGIEEAQHALEGLGFSAVKFSDIANKQGDVAAEIVRQSIERMEVLVPAVQTANINGTGTTIRPAIPTGIGEIIGTIDGTASEIVDAYKQLVDVRQALAAVGVQGDVVGRSLLQGAGGLEKLGDALRTFQDSYLTDEQRLAIATDNLTGQFGKLNLAMPQSAAGFVDLVRSIDTTTDSGRKLLGQVLGLADGFSVLAEHERAVQEQRQGLQDQLDQLEGNTTALRQRELAALDPSNRALQERIYALQDSKAAEQAAAQLTSQRTSLERQILQLTGDTAEIRKRELDALDPSLRALQERIYALQDEQAATAAAATAAKDLESKQQAIANERYGLETQLLQLQGNTAELRKRELEKLDPTNRALQEMIYTLQDQQAASQAAQASAQQAAQQAEELQRAWQQVGDSIAQEIERIRGVTGGGASLAELQSQFAVKTAQARAGDQAAAQSLPQISQALLQAAEAVATSTFDLAVLKGQTAGSLEETLKALGNYGVKVPGFAEGGDFGGGLRLVGENGPELEVTGPSRIYTADQTARMLAGGRNDRSAEEIAALRQQVAELQQTLVDIGLPIVKATRRTADVLTNVTAAEGGLAISTKETA